MKSRELISVDEWYHCYSRGVDKRIVFSDATDYARFVQLLYLSNSTTPIHRNAITKLSFGEIFQIERDEPLVAIGAYCLMPNHFHILAREIREGGLSEFMRKLGIAYAMYFNIKNDRVGNLFVKPFRAKHVSSDEYFKRVAQYIHLNSAELFEPGWKEGRVADIRGLEEKISQYPYSSFFDYNGRHRPERVILEKGAADLIGSTMPPLTEIITETLLYYRDLSR